MRKTYKKVISLFAVLIFALALIPIQTFAQDPFTSVVIGGTGLGASGLFSAVSAGMGVNITPSNDPIANDALWAGVDSAGISISGTKHKASGTGSDTKDYIEVNQTVFTNIRQYIDSGINNWNITDNDSGSIQSSASVQGFPVGTILKIVPYQGYSQFTIGDTTVTYESAGNNGRFVFTGPSLENSPTTVYDASAGITSIQITARYYNSKPQYYVGAYNKSYSLGYVALKSNQYKPATSFNYTSGIIDPDFADDYQTVKISIPSDPDLTSNFTIEEFMEALNEKILTAIQDIEITDGSIVPPEPVPSTPLGDIPTDDWYDLFGLPVLDGQEEIHQDLQDFNDSVSDGIDDVIGELEDIESDVESIDTNIGIGNGLLGDLKSIGQSIQSTLSSILSGVTDLVQEIVLSTETFIAGILNSIMGSLGGWLSTMREAFSIWHYVVEWVGSISTVFSWFWSVAGSTSYYIQLPIYASLAGAVVLAFYKRFGK